MNRERAERLVEQSAEIAHRSEMYYAHLCNASGLLPEEHAEIIAESMLQFHVPHLTANEVRSAALRGCLKAEERKDES